MYNARSSRRYTQWDRHSSHPQDHRFVHGNGFDTGAGLRNMSGREREELWRRAQDRVHDPYSSSRQRSRAHAAEDAIRQERNHRRRNSGVDEVAEWMSRMNMGERGARGSRSDHNIRRRDQYAAPEPPRINPRNAEYYLDRAYRPSHTYQDNYNDAYRYINGRHPGHRTEPTGRRHDPREDNNRNLRSALDGGRDRGLVRSRWDRVRNWF